MSSTNRKPSSWWVVFGDPGYRGLVARSISIVAVQLMVLTGFIGAIGVGWIDCPWDDLMIVFAVMLICQVVGQIVSERPAGPDWTWFRLLSSIAARTLFPLLFLVSSDLFVEPGFIDRTLLVLIIFYFVGLVFSSAQMVIRGSNSGLNESLPTSPPVK